MFTKKTVTVVQSQLSAALCLLVGVCYVETQREIKKRDVIRDRVRTVTATPTHRATRPLNVYDVYTSYTSGCFVWIRGFRAECLPVCIVSLDVSLVYMSRNGL